MPPQNRIHPSELVPDRLDAIEDHQQVDVRLGMSVPPRPRPEEQDAPEPLAVKLAQIPCDAASDLASIECAAEFGELRLRMLWQRPPAHLLVDEPLVNEPLNRLPLEASIVKAEPRVAQLREVEQGVFEAAKGAAPGDRPLE